MVPWSITAVRKGDVQEPSQVPYKPRAPEQILNEAWDRHADSKSTVSSKPRKPASRHHVGLSRFQFGDAEYEASVASFRKYHARTPEQEPLPEMQELVQATRTLARTNLRADYLSAGQCPHQPCMASIRRRHSAGEHLLALGTSSAGDGDAEADSDNAEVEAFSGSESDEATHGGGPSASGFGAAEGPAAAAAAATAAASVVADMADGGRGGEYGRPSLPLTAGLLVPTVSTTAVQFQRRKPSTCSFRGQVLDGEYGRPSQRPIVLQGRFSVVEGVTCDSGSGCDGGGGGDDDDDDGDDDDKGSDPSVRRGLLDHHDSAPGRQASHVRQSDAANLSVRRSNGDVVVSGTGGGGGGVTVPGVPFSRNNPATRRATLSVLSPPPPPPSDYDAPLQPQYSQPSSVGDASTAYSVDRVSQMLHELRIAKRPEPPSVILPMAPGSLACSGNPRQQRTQRAAAAASGSGGSDAAAAGGGGRIRRCSGLLTAEAADVVPRLIVSSSPKREPRGTAASPRFQASAAAAAAVAGSPSSPSLSMASPVQAYAETEPLPLQPRQSGGSPGPWPPGGGGGGLRDSTEAEVMLFGAHRGGGPLGSTAAAAVASPASPASCWPSISPMLPAAAAAEAATAAAAAAAAAVRSSGSRSDLAGPLHSKSQTAVGSPVALQSRSSGGAPLGGWTSRPLARNQPRQSMPNGGGGAAAAVPHSVHFAADAVGPVSFRCGSSSSIGSSCDDGPPPASGAGGHRFGWAAASSGGCGCSGGGGGGGSAAAVMLASTASATAALGLSECGGGGAGGGGQRTPRTSEQGGGGRSVGRMLGSLLHGIRRDSNSGIK